MGRRRRSHPRTTAPNGGWHAHPRRQRPACWQLQTAMGGRGNYRQTSHRRQPACPPASSAPRALAVANRHGRAGGEIIDSRRIVDNRHAYPHRQRPERWQLQTAMGGRAGKLSTDAASLATVKARRRRPQFERPPPLLDQIALGEALIEHVPRQFFINSARSI